MSARRLIAFVLTCSCTAAGGLLLGSAPAAAQRIHEFSFSFGSEGSGEGQFLRPGQMAVNDATGDVYVIDRGNDRVDVFSATGEYKFDFNGSTAPKGSFNFASEEHNENEGGIAIDNSGNPGDPSAGDVYVADTGHQVVDKFTAGGVFINQIKLPSGLPEFTDTPAVGVDANGVLWVAAGKNIEGLTAEAGGGTFYELNDASTNEIVKAVVPTLPERHGSQHMGLGNDGLVITTENGGALYTEECGFGCSVNSFEHEPLYHDHILAKFTEEGGFISDEYQSEEIYRNNEDVNGVALDQTSNDVYVDDMTDIVAFGPEASSVPIERFGAAQLGFFKEGGFADEYPEASEGIAVNSATGMVYASDSVNGSEAVYAFKAKLVPDVSTHSTSNLGETSATLNGVTNPDGLPVTSCVFEYGPTTAYGHEEPCSSSPGSSSTPVEVSANLTGLEHLATYHYRLRVSNANGTNYGSDETFGTPEPGEISEETVSDVSDTSALFSAQVNPENAETSFTFEYGTSTAYGTVVPATAGILSAGLTPVPAAARPNGLQPGVTYHMRSVAHNVLGSVYGPDEVFTTQPAAEGFTLPDGRVWEMVTLPLKYGAIIQPLGFSVVEASEAGSALTYVANIPIGSQAASNNAPEFPSQVLSRRSATGWATENIVTPRSAETGHHIGEYKQFSDDLSQALVEPESTFFDQLSPEATGPTPYLRDDETATYVPLVSAHDVPPGTQFAVEGAAQETEPHVAAATPDLSHVLLSTHHPLTANAKEMPYANENGLYEWSGGTLKLVDVLPNGKQSGDGVVGESGIDIDHAISDDGSKVFWMETERGGSPTALYMRDTATEQTVQVDAPAPGMATPSASWAAFQAASADGSKVFFTEAEPLTPASKVPITKIGFESPHGDDLYVYNTVTGKLTDLTGGGGASGSEPGEPVGQMVASEDGSTVYFVARGALASGAQAGELNLYVENETGSGWSAPHLIAVLSERTLTTSSGEDEAGWGGGRYEVSRVSPNGQFLAFMSNRSLTGYDNRDLVSGKPDEEVYLYDDASGSLVCVSCNPTGERPVGIYDQAERGEPGARQFDDGGEWWVGHWLAALVPGQTGDGASQYLSERAAYQQRYLSNEGRLFFDGWDPLVPQAANARANVYEFEPPGVGSCSRAGGCVSLISSGTSSEDADFLDASESGGDVFFLTSARLVPQDLDTSMDVYDAHACTAASPCVSSPVPAPPCSSGDACKAAPSPQPTVFGPPASATFSGTGNVIPEVGTVQKKTTTKTKKKAAKCQRPKRLEHGRCVKAARQSGKGVKSSKRGSKASRGGRS
jgi:hypothetical protein